MQANIDASELIIDASKYGALRKLHLSGTRLGYRRDAADGLLWHYIPMFKQLNHSLGVYIKAACLVHHYI